MCIDFETTGLDIEKDEAIQLAVVKFDGEWKILKQFCSYLKPNKEIKKMAGFVTGISMKDLENAPKITEMESEIKSFFDENTIVVWHNINFDLSFLKKYFSDIKYCDKIDTFMLAQNLVHFAPSYALEVLIKVLKNNNNNTKLIERKENEKQDSKDQDHDALFDVMNTIWIFQYFINNILEIISEYPQIWNIFAKVDWIWSDILIFNKPWSASSNTKIILPSLWKELPRNLSLSVDDWIEIEELEDRKKYYIWNYNLDELLKKLLLNKKIILSFSSLPKLNIVKNILNDIWLKNIWFNTWEQKINHEKLTKFVNKYWFEEWELFFILKYLSHCKQKYSFLDSNNVNDWNILYYLKEDNKYFQYPVVLNTHAGLFTALKKKDFAYKNYEILFFDTEFWYRWYNNFLSGRQDLYTILNFIEKLIYKYKIDENIKILEILQEFHSLFCTFMWIIFGELKLKFTNTTENKRQINPIQDNIDFYKTNLFFEKIKNFYSVLQESLDVNDWELLIWKLEDMFDLLNKIVIVEKKLYSKEWDFYFLFQESVQFTDWSEFTEIFANQKTLFLSNQDDKFDSIKKTESIFENNLSYKKIENTKKVLDYLKNSKEENIFVLSSKKDKSQLLFDELMNCWLHTQRMLLAENITGWVWKNIFKSKLEWRKIIIWGYNFILQIFANKINMDKIIVFDIKWALESNILNDIIRYGNYKQK